MFISQDLFDETLLESQELLDTTDEDAVTEAVSELESSHGGNICLDHLSLTHPHSAQGREERQKRDIFVFAVKDGDFGSALRYLEQRAAEDGSSGAAPDNDNSIGKKKMLLICQTLILQNDLLPSVFRFLEFVKGEDDSTIKNALEFLAATVRQTTTATPDLLLKMTQPLENYWFRLYCEVPSLRASLLRWARLSCNGYEANKKSFVQAGVLYRTGGEKNCNGLELILGSVPDHLEIPSVTSDQKCDKENSNEDEAAQHQLELMIVHEICLLIAVLGRFQTSEETRQQHKPQQQEPLVSSAHANVLEFYRCNAVPKLHRLAKGILDVESKESGNSNVELCASILSALRVMAIDNDIVQNMVAVGILETAELSLSTFSSFSTKEELETYQAYSPVLASATLGLLRNLCANDEIKNNVCKKSLPSILHAMEILASNHSVQEQGCGILAAMALREPLNSKAIIEANGPHFIIQAMRNFPNKIPLQRQGALSLRNLASRLSTDEKNVLLDYGAESVLRDVTARHQGSIEEAYAALRDLGCEVVMYNIDNSGKAHGIQMFGQVNSNFRKTLESSLDASEASSVYD